jgi:hypothetical protein
VSGYTVDSESFFVVKLQVKPTFLQSFGQAELLIDRTQIREINDKHILVRRATVQDEKRAVFSSIPTIDNPFRKAPRTATEAHELEHREKESKGPTGDSANAAKG